MRHSISLICFSLILTTGCYTYSSVDIEGQHVTFPNPEDAIRITMTDGSVIESPEYLHILTKEPCDLVIGIGQQRLNSTSFKGVIAKSEMDSMAEISAKDGLFLVCWLKNRNQLGFKSGEYLIVTSKDSVGFWCAGKKFSSEGETPFRGILSPVQISKLEVSRVNSLLIAQFILAPILIYILVVEIIELARHIPSPSPHAL